MVNSGFCVANGIVALATKGLYVGALIKKRRYYSKNATGDPIERIFVYKDVGGVVMLGAATEVGKTLCIFFFKDPDYVMNIMSSWMTLDELEGFNMKRNYKGRYGESLVKIFKYQQPFVLHFLTIIIYTITPIGSTLIYHWRGHGVPSFGLIINFCGTFP